MMKNYGEEKEEVFKIKKKTKENTRPFIKYFY